MFEEHNEAKQKVYRLAAGYIDQETQGELRQLDKRFREQLRTVLTPEQVEDFELRTSDLSSQLRSDLQHFDQTEEEFRALFRFKQAEADLAASRPRAKDGVQPTAEEWKNYREQEKQAQESLNAALGSERAKEYELVKDWSYRQLFEMGVGKESVAKVADSSSPPSPPLRN